MYCYTSKGKWALVCNLIIPTCANPNSLSLYKLYRVFDVNCRIAEDQVLSLSLKDIFILTFGEQSLKELLMHESSYILTPQTRGVGIVQ